MEKQGKRSNDCTLPSKHYIPLILGQKETKQISDQKRFHVGGQVRMWFGRRGNNDVFCKTTRRIRVYPIGTESQFM